MANRNTNTKTPNPKNPSSLSERYEIRKLEPQHSSWAGAIVIHSNVFHSPLWPVLYPTGLTERALKAVSSASYLVDHQIASGMSFGVFDTQYTIKRSESASTGGKLYWGEGSTLEDGTEQGKEKESKRLLEQMDFPLVSVALSYDQADPLDEEKLGPVLEVLPHFGSIYHILDEKDPRAKKSWKCEGKGEVLMRNATSTRREYEGEKIMGGLARWLMREADQEGYRGIQIECVHDAVHHVWSNPPAPYKGFVVSQFNCDTYKDEKKEFESLGYGEFPFRPAKQTCSKVYVEIQAKLLN